MILMLKHHREQLAVLCRKHHVRRLEVFGSAATGEFDTTSSDVDLLVEFEDMPFADRADAYLGLLTGLQALLDHPIDLLESSAVRNPYLRQGIDASRELLYAA